MTRSLEATIRSWADGNNATASFLMAMFCDLLPRNVAVAVAVAVAVVLSSHSSMTPSSNWIDHRAGPRLHWLLETVAVRVISPLRGTTAGTCTRKKMAAALRDSVAVSDCTSLSSGRSNVRPFVCIVHSSCSSNSDRGGPARHSHQSSVGICFIWTLKRPDHVEVVDDSSTSTGLANPPRNNPKPRTSI